MKRNALVIGLLLLAACSGDDAPLQTADADTWEVAVSRSVEGSDKVLVWVGAIDAQANNQGGVLVPPTGDADNGKWSWQGNTKPSWPDDNSTTSVIALSPAPDTNKLPTTVKASDGNTWMVDYKASASSSNKPTSFTMTHLMAQLQIHLQNIGVMLGTEPTRITIALHTGARIDYPNKKLKDPTGRDYANHNYTFSSFKPTDDKNYWLTDVRLVIPQNLEKKVTCLTLYSKAGGSYTFTPEEELKILSGKVNHLYLGVVEDNAIQLTKASITDWITADEGTATAEEEL